jgi:thiosulfate dehydrogenase
MRHKLWLSVAALVGVAACGKSEPRVLIPWPPEPGHASAAKASAAAPAAQVKAAAQPAVGMSDVFEPPARGAYPEGEFGEAVKRGERIFKDTKRYAGRFVGNEMSCANCHLDDGRRAGSTPMWAAWGLYPAYRAKNKRVNTMAERLQGCFTFSMNAQASEAGEAPEALDPVIVELEAYIYWLATGAPAGVKLKGQGYPALDKPAEAPSRERGKAVYEAQCAICHGEDGQGLADPAGGVAFPALWGEGSFNWGAGMHRTNTAAAFIRANMPLGKPNTLTEQEAWDVAAYMNSHERPADPRQGAGTLATTDKTYHDEDCQYGDEVGGDLLGNGR